MKHSSNSTAGKPALQLITRLVLATLGSAAMAGAVHAADGDQAQPITLSTITVTGEKIDRELDATIGAVTVLRSPQVDQGDMQSVYDVIDRVPNVSANADGMPNIRGVAGTGPATGVFSFISGARPRVSTSVDGVAESWAGQSYLGAGMWDVEQVEVLRGPQSTTQGRNTLGGAIIVNTRDPSFKWEGALRAGYENQDGKALLAAVISGPLVADELAFRLAAEGLRGNGFIDYKGGTFPWDPSEIRRNSVRAKLLWAPKSNPNLTAKLTVSQRTQKGEYLNFVEGADFFDYQFAGINSNTRRQDSSNTTIGADIEYTLTPNLSARLLASHSAYVARFEESGNDRFSLDLDEKNHMLEARLVYAPQGGAWQGVAGIYHFKRKQDLNAVPDGFVGKDKVSTMAVYGESTLALNPALDLIVGARFEREEQNRDVTAWPGRPWQGRVLTDISEPVFLPKLGLAYKVSPTTSLGLTARKGYNAGGGSIDWVTSQFYEFDKEEVQTYELSARTNLLGERVKLRANLFYNDYDGYQAMLNRRFVNLPKGSSQGLEFEARAAVSRTLELSGAIGLLDTEIRQAPEGNPAIAGNAFNYAPKVTANAGLRKQLGHGFVVDTNVSYVGKYFSEIDNDARYKAGGYMLANLNLGYDTGRYSIRAYVRNLADRKVLFYRNEKLGQVGQPRTIGLTVDARF
jgi:iron complex outermembrane receptor protein